MLPYGRVKYMCIKCETERLILRRFRESDINTVYELSREAGLMKYLPDQCYGDIGEAADTVRFLIDRCREKAFPYVLAVELKRTGELIGHVGLSELPGGIEIGYAIGEKHQTHGYAAEAVGEFIFYAHRMFALPAILGVADAGNIPSQRVLEKAGFAFASELGGRRLYKRSFCMLEPMADFFAARADGYDEHMLNDVPGCREGYIKMASLVPPDTRTLLDLGCGTGLELDGIFKKLPCVSVTGIDLSQVMLDRLRQKHPDRNITLVCGDYFKFDMGEERFDAAVSFQTLHHFSRRDKTELYSRIYRALRTGGIYIECDYMVERQEDEDLYFAENERLRRAQGAADGGFYHYDTPCTIENQLLMFREAGFSFPALIWRRENTTIITGTK